ncbi:MAG: hypothetical protein WAV04_00265 [Candidatus Microsaccharimonas sp.]
MQPTNNAALRKRTQIAKANRTMFLWIAAGSVIVGCALVVAYFLGQKLIYNERVLAEKEKTVAILKSNNEVIPELETQVRVLDTNTALKSVLASDDDQTIQVILDALPADANSLALGASLQNKLLAGIPGLTIESLQVDPVVGVESLSDINANEQDASAGVSGNQITFQFSVNGSPEALKQVLTNLERSIRAIDILSLRIESQGNKQLMSVQARAFYEPAKTIELTDKVVQ